MRSFSRPAFAVALLVCVMSSLPSVARAGALLNGGFESPVVAVGSFQNFSTGGDIDGWTVVGAQSSIVETTFSQNGFNFHAQSGNQWLDLTGFGSNSAEGVEQTVTTAAGSTYKVTFWVGNVVDESGVFGNSSTVDLYIDGAKKLSATNTNGTTQQIWKQFEFSFTASTSSTLVKFLNADGASDNDNGLDNISIDLEGTGPTPVPLPPAAHAALALMATLVVGKFVVRWFAKAS